MANQAPNRGRAVSGLEPGEGVESGACWSGRWGSGGLVVGGGGVCAWRRDVRLSCDHKEQVDSRWDWWARS